MIFNSRAQKEQQKPRITEKGSNSPSVRPAAPEKFSSSQSDVVKVVKPRDAATSGGFKLPGQSEASMVSFLVFLAPLFRYLYQDHSFRLTGTICF